MRKSMIGKISVQLIACILFLVVRSYCQIPADSIIKNRTITKKSNILHYLNATAWNQLFPHRYGIGLKDTIKHNKDFYSYASFIKAANYFPDFIAEGDDTIQKRELAAFLANIAQETSGGWKDAPGGYFKWGLYFLQEGQVTNPDYYSDTSKKSFPPVPGKQYFGRGPKQLSWNYNYGQFSKAWYGNRDTLLEYPERLAMDPVLSMASAIWFWMTPQPPKPSCHDIITGKWHPTENDIAKGRLPGFGATVNVINGGVECGNGADIDKTTYRYQYYLYFCNYFHVSPGDNIACTNQKPFNQ